MRVLAWRGAPTQSEGSHVTPVTPYQRRGAVARFQGHVAGERVPAGPKIGSGGAPGSAAENQKSRFDYGAMRRTTWEKSASILRPSSKFESRPAGEGSWPSLRKSDADEALIHPNYLAFPLDGAIPEKIQRKARRQIRQRKRDR